MLRNAALLAIVLSALGYLVIYATTPHDLRWHLEYSLDRLILHLFPALVYTLARRRKT